MQTPQHAAESSTTTTPSENLRETEEPRVLGTGGLADRIGSFLVFCLVVGSIWALTSTAKQNSRQQGFEEGREAERRQYLHDQGIDPNLGVPYHSPEHPINWNTEQTLPTYPIDN